MATASDTLVIFDFDDSLVNKDSDTFVLQHLAPELAQTLNARHALHPVWPDVFDDLLQVIAHEKPHVTTETIWEHVERIPMQERMQDAIRLAVEQFGADVKIVSDGNTFYINRVLENRGLAQHVSDVIANPAEFAELDDGRTWLRIRPYHAKKESPIGCKHCPSNMCKGAILESIRSDHAYSRVVYVGDGPGDFCPVTRLTTNDVVCARTDTSDGPSFELHKRIKSNPGMVKARVAFWNTGEDLYLVFSRVFADST